MALQTWDLWIPDAASRGISFGRGVLDASDEVLVHSPPSALRVEVRNEAGHQVARGDNLHRTADAPMARLRVTGGQVQREDAWPEAADVGRLVILPGGEVGVLRSWEAAPDHSRWRWSVEFSNHR